MNTRPEIASRAHYDLSIIGTVGLPAAYGGFETLAEQITRRLSSRHRIQVFCSGKRYLDTAGRPVTCDGADLQYVEFDANGPQSIAYDAVSLWRSAPRSRTLLVLGVSGALLLPVVRWFWPDARIVTNIDGLEWKRAKWGCVARAILRWSEWSAVRYSHAVISDNQGIRDHVSETYGRDSVLITYGGDQQGSEPPPPAFEADPTREAGYFLGICRIEPENNIECILDAFAAMPGQRLVMVGNWSSSEFATGLRRRHAATPNLELLDPIYDLARLNVLRAGAKCYVHGHSAGGTNPSLVEAMHAGMAILAFDVNYNRYTTNHRAAYWHDAADLVRCASALTADELQRIAASMKSLAADLYTWDRVVAEYEAVLFATS